MTESPAPPNRDPREKHSPRLGLGRLTGPGTGPGDVPDELFARRRVPARPAVLLAVAGLVALLLFQLSWTRLTVERSIENRTRSAVARAGFVLVTVDSSGRDVTLEGKTATLNEAYQATRIARVQEGVRTVRSSITVDPSVITATIAKARADAKAAGIDVGADTPTELPATPTVDITMGAKKIRLAGVVGDQMAKDQLMSAAEKVFGAANVSDDLLVDASAGTVGASGLIVAVGALDASASGTFRLQLGTVTLSGTVSSVAVHDRVLALTRSRLGDLAKVTDNLVVVKAGPDKELEQRLSSLPSPAFTKNTDDLSAAGKSTVEDIAAALKSAPTFKVRIDGHVDVASSTANTDRVSSEKRAAAVRDLLVDEGIPASRLSTRAFGDTEPLVPITKAVDRIINTRIDITVLS